MQRLAQRQPLLDSQRLGPPVGRDVAGGEGGAHALTVEAGQLAREHVVDHLAPLAEAGLHEAVRRLLESAGGTLRDVEYSGSKTRCCGHGGMLRAIDPDRDLAECLPVPRSNNEAIGTVRPDIAYELGIPAGIPVAMTAAIAIMWMAGLTLNMISLFALALVGAGAFTLLPGHGIVIT